MRIFLLVLGVILFTCGIKLIYDARIIVKNYFSTNDENVTVNIIKGAGTFSVVLGFILLIIYL